MEGIYKRAKICLEKHVSTKKRQLQKVDLCSLLIYYLYLLRCTYIRTVKFSEGANSILELDNANITRKTHYKKC